jgi:hypothetical protein
MRLALALLLCALTLSVAAQEVPLPRERPEAVGGESAVPLPRPRPEPKIAAEPVVAEKAAPAKAEEPAEEEVAPPKPPRIYQIACPAVLMGMVEAQVLPPIAENQCGERSPLSVTGVLANGRMVPFSGAATLNCGMASALPAWAAAVDSYLMARENTRIARLLVGTSYMCRPRNHAEGADVSEHGFANGLDVVGFELEDGRTVTLSTGWAEALAPEGRLLRFAHDAGCANFTTTLGPEANAAHADHLHLDLGCHGKSCTARLCE